MDTTPVAIFGVDADLVRALETALGPPIDSYLMGWQVWLVDEVVEGQDVTLEYRLHPPAGFAQPAGLDHHDLWDEVVAQLAGDDTGQSPRLRLGDEERPLSGVWDLLEVYPAFGEQLAPEQVRGLAQAALGRPAAAAGEVDHQRLGGRWKRQQHEFDLPAALRQALGAD